MYLLRTEFQIAAGRAKEFEDRQTRAGEMRKGQPGYVGQTFLHSYGHPSKYVVNTRWANVEAAWAWGKSEMFANAMKNTPLGVATVTLQEGYESVFEVDADTMQGNPGTSETLTDWTINLGAAAAFEANRRELFELRKKHAMGFASNRLRRNAGNGNKYLVLQMYSDIGASRAANSVPEIQAYQVAHPNSQFASAPLVAEAYYVIHRM